MRAVTFIIAALTVAIAASTSPPSASALTKDELRCQSSIGDVAHDFTRHKLKALLQCADDVTDEGSCDTDRRDRRIEASTTKLANQLTRDCRDVTLENIGFPGPCIDPDGGTFTTSDLVSCITDQLESAVDAAIALAFPDLSQASKEDGRCQRAIGRVARGFFVRKFGARSRCFAQQLRGKLPPSVNCLAEVPPGTGDTDTDQLIMEAMRLVSGKIIPKACRNADLTALGFPGSCPDLTGGDFTIADLQACILSEVERAVDELIALLFPPSGPVATPTATAPVETPTPVETGTAGETPTPVETGTAGETPTPVETGTAGETPTPAETGTAGETPTPVETGTAGETPTPSETTTPAGTPSATASPAATATPVPTETATVGPTATATPVPTTTATATIVATESPTPVPTSTPSGAACPSQISFLADGDAADLDTGWTGQSHDNRVINNGLVTVNVTGCANPSSPCGVCDVSGPAPNAGGTESNNHRCTGDTSVQCTTDTDCTGLGTCAFFFGAPLPLSSGGVSVCVINQVTGTITGTVDVDAGDASNSVPLISRVFTGPTLNNPCPICGTGGFGTTSTCSGGANAGKACTVNGTSPLFGSTSFDCPPTSGAIIATLNIPLTLTTGAQTRSLSASSPNCTAIGFTTATCFCDTCATSAAEACATNADCPGGAACGGTRCVSGTNAGAACTVTSECPGSLCGRPGKTTAPNECSDGTCSANAADTDSVDEGQCAAGPFEQFCDIERFRGCSSNADCTATGDACTFGKFRECYTDNGVSGNSVQVQGTAAPFVGGTSDGTLGAFFCVGPTTSGSVNSVAGLPGLGRLTLPGTATLIP